MSDVGGSSPHALTSVKSLGLIALPLHGGVGLHHALREQANVGGEWHKLAMIYWSLGSPLRPAPSDIEATRRALEGHDRHVLLLGVTPALSVLGEKLTAVDHSPLMIEHVWPGDDDRRKAMLGDWTELPFEARSFSAVIGDGSLTPAGEGVDDTLSEVRRVLAPGGVAIFRLFCQADDPECLADIRADVADGWQGNIHALKWRIAMALVAEKPRPLAPAKEVLVAFNSIFPDRRWLAERTGWTQEEIGTLDAFETATHQVCFLTLQQMLERGRRYFRSVRVVEGSGYPLAERCPTVVWTA